VGELAGCSDYLLHFVIAINTKWLHMSYFYPSLPQADANFSCYLRKFSNNKPCLREKIIFADNAIKE
jgi:hypothetical protein